MPDKDDPQYKARYEKEVDAGKRFARWSHIDILAAKVQRWAMKNEKTFLLLVFGIVIGCFLFNMVSIIRVANATAHKAVTVSERQEQLLDSLRKSDGIKQDTHRVERKENK